MLINHRNKIIEHRGTKYHNYNIKVNPKEDLTLPKLKEGFTLDQYKDKLDELCNMIEDYPLLYLQNYCFNGFQFKIYKMEAQE